ncbi:MAG: lysophospholipid acyltransferase family protein, partial [Rhodobacteraceae bacterium]|nr:lysophospholipid acyltransferase family protein [Paracoccaceae bacterium]
YGNTFEGSWREPVIRTIEWFTGKTTLLRLVRIYESTPRPASQSFFSRALELLEIDLLTPHDEIARIPAEGPLVLAANHPHGLVDGLVLAVLLERVRSDFKILTRELLNTVPEITHHMLPVAFPHEQDMIRKNIAMRKEAMAHLDAGGSIIMFPSGNVAAAPSWNADAEEAPWTPFTAKLIRKSEAAVVPVYFPGQNSRLYARASLISSALRQSLLLHEIVHAMKTPQRPHIGHPIGRDLINQQDTNPEAFMAWLRARTLALGEASPRTS